MACQVSITWCFLLSPVRYHIHPTIIEPITNSLRAALFSDVYHFSIGMGGLAYIGLGLGFLLSAIVGAKVSNQIYVYVCQDYLVLTMLIEVLLQSLLTEMQDRVNQRCVCLLWYSARSLSQWGSCEIDSLSFSLDLIYVRWYGWSAQAHVHFMMPIIGTAIFGFGMMTTLLV